MDIENNKNTSFPSYSRQMAKILTSTTQKSGDTVDKADAEKAIADYLTKHRVAELNSNKDDEVEVHTKTKKDMRAYLDETRSLISDCIFSQSIKIRNCGLEEFITEMVSEYGGYSVLDEAFADDEVNDIFCLGWNNIFVEKNGVNVPYWKTFRNEDHYNKVVERFLRVDGKEINIGDKKIVDAELYGDRLCATSKAVTPDGVTLTIRKHKEVHIVLEEMMNTNLMTEEMKDLFGLIIDGEGNLIYAGITGSGKSTTIRALLDHFVPKNGKRMIVCEETQELFPANPHTMQMVSNKSSKENLAISLYDLIITGLRLKPKYIVVGEVRGVEAAAAVEAMETGHSTIFTMHGGTVWNNINRLVTKYIMQMPSLGTEVVQRIIGAAVDYIAIQDDTPGIGRVVSSIDEISYDFENNKIIVTPIFKYDRIKNDFVFLNRIAPEKADKMMRRGVKIDRIRDWIREGTPKEPTDNDKAFVEHINATYQAEKQSRREMYKKVVEEIKEKRRQAKQSTLTDDYSQTSEIVDMMKKMDDLRMASVISTTRNLENTGNKEVAEN